MSGIKNGIGGRYISRADFDTLTRELHHKCDEITQRGVGTINDGHVISGFVAGWAKQRGLTHLDLPNVFGVISGTFSANSQVYLAEYASGWTVLEGHALRLKLRSIKTLIADALEKDKAHFAKLKLNAIAEAQAAAVAFAYSV